MENVPRSNGTMSRRKPTRKKKALMDLWEDRGAILDRVLTALDNGLSLRKAAKAAGVHVSTLCRWQNRSEFVATALAEAAEGGKMERRRSRVANRGRWGL